MPRQIRALALVILVAACGAAEGQSPDRFTARLSWVPVSLAEQRLVGGQGSATATLSRQRLLIQGSFRGLPAAATAARLHHGTATGARGPAIADLSFTASTDGTFTGNVELGREQRAALVAGHLYIQIYADPGVPPDNAILRGWLLAYDQAAATSAFRD